MGSPLSRRRLLAAAASGGAGGLLAACSGQGTPSSQKTVTFPAELRWMPWSAHESWLAPTYEEVAAQFNQRYPQTKLTLLPTPADWLVKLKTMISAGQPPDVNDVHHGGQVRDLGPSRQVIDLSAYLKNTNYPKTYAGWEPYAWQKKQYGVPWALQSTAIFYNKQLFDQAGVKYPADTWTWDDFADAARRLTKPGADDASTIWGAGDQGGQNYQWMNALFTAFGGGILKPDYSECVITSPAALAAMEFRAGWGSKLRIARNQPGGTAGNFTTGMYAMVTSGSWFVANVKRSSESRLLQANVPWDVAAVPKGRSRRAALAHELGLGIANGVQNPDASWAVIRFLTTPESLLPFAKIGRILPADRSLWKDAAPADGLPATFRKAFLDVWDEINVEPPFVPRWSDVDAMWKEELDKVWTGDRPAKDGATALKTRLDQHLQQLKRDGML